MKALLVSLVALAAAPLPAWIQRAVPLPIVTWREADVRGKGSGPMPSAADR